MISLRIRLILPLLLCATASGAAPVVTIPFVAKGPALRGDLSDLLWHSGAIMTEFASISATSVTAQTEARLLYDSKYLYIGVRCSEPNPKNLVARVKDRDGSVWQDDCIEILLDTANARGVCYHIMVNYIGAIADEKVLGADRTDPSWNINCREKVGRAPGAWTLEVAVPFEELGVTPTPGLVWGLNICRGRPAAKEYSAWSPSPGGFVEPQNFGQVVFGDEVGTWNGVRLTSWGNLSPDTTLGGRNVLECSIPNGYATAKAFDVTLRGGPVNVSRRAEVLPGETEVVEIPYTPSASPKEKYALTVSSDGKEIFSATHPAMVVPSPARVWNLTDPLFEELLSKNPPGEQKNGVIYWFHSSIASELRPFAKEYGLRYSLDEAYRELLEYEFLPVANSSMMMGEPMRSMSDKYPFRFAFEPLYSQSRHVGVPEIDGLPFIFDSRSKASYFLDLRNTIGRRGTHIYGIYTQDEFTEKAVEQGVSFFSQMNDTYPLVKQIDEEVKKQFGYSKFGIPTSTDDANPFRWIAYRKWINRQMLEWQREVWQTVHAIMPEIKVISIDPTAGHKPYGLDRISPYVDIVTHQTYPMANPNLQEVGFVTKFVADLTGKPVWPCTHVENYAYSVTPEEVRELMSQVMRNGGKGFHLYIPDVRGGRASSGDTMLTKYGCPERFRAITEIVKQVERMNEVAIPTDPDSAIFYSEDHYQSFGINHAFTNEPQYLYTFLGPVARTWFKFVNDNMVEDGRAKLGRYKAVFIPAAKYERRQILRTLTDYVRGGGTLVCGDPEAFFWSPDGSSLSSARKELLGLSSASSASRQTIAFGLRCSLRRLRGMKLHVFSHTFDLKSLGGSEVLARFDDGSPAVVRRRIGKGSIILFAFNPFAGAAVGDAGWKAAFKALALDLGLKTGRNIWRFKFPPFKTVYRPDPDGICLTGNYVKWQQEHPLDICNSTIKGSYTYSLAPDAVPDRGDASGADFLTGKLTDRKRAPTVPKTSLKPEDFIVTWKTQKPVAVTFDFGAEYPIQRVALWYSDQLPAMTVEGSGDGVNWVKLADNPKQDSTQDVLDVSLSWAAQKARYIRLSFGERDAGKAMTLAECEVWAER